jgi:hypothetical protein
MIAASSVEEIRCGRYRLVLGEMHAAINSLCRSLFVNQHPSPEELFKATEADLPEPRVLPVIPRSSFGSRGIFMLLSPKDYHLEMWLGSTAPSKSNSLHIGSLFVEHNGAGLVARTADGRLEFDLVEVFADLLTSMVATKFRVLPPGPHTPRVTIDKLIVARETWQFAAEELEFAFDQDEAHRFAGARKWSRDAGLPRFLFYKSPVETKPCFLDLQSPILVNLFSKVVRRTARDVSKEVAVSRNHNITLSEMIPAPQETWLPDSEGNTYTSEFRIVAVDLSH